MNGLKMKKQIIIGMDYSSKNIYLSYLDQNGKTIRVEYKEKKNKKKKHIEVDFYNEVLSLIKIIPNFNAEYKIFVFSEKSISELLAEVKGMIKTELINTFGINIRFYNLFSSDIIKMLNFTEILELNEPEYFAKNYLNKDGTHTNFLRRPDMKKCFKYFGIMNKLSPNHTQDYYDSFGIARTGFNLLDFYGEN